MSRRIVDLKLMNILSIIIAEKFNKIKLDKSPKEKLKVIFKDKDIISLMGEFSNFLNDLSEDYKKEKPKYTVIFVIALLMRSLNDKERIYEALKQFNLINQLYGGLSILLNGKASKFAINVSLNDECYENRYRYISRVNGNFYFNNIEIVLATEIIFMDNQSKFENLALKDKTKIILFNICSGTYQITPSEKFINQLISGNNELDKNIGFYILTSELRFSISEKKNITHYKSNGIKREGIGIRAINRIIINELQKIDRCLKQFDNKTKVSLLTNYLLVEKYHPKCFYAWLLSPQSYEYIAEEIKYTNKLKGLSDVLVYLKIIHSRITLYKGIKPRKSILYDAIVDLIISFVNNKIGIYEWGEYEKKEFNEICNILPKIPKNKIKKSLLNEKQKCMSLKFDSLVRFNIYLEHSKKQEIIDGMLELL